MMSSGRWLAMGSALLGVGALLAVTWLVYSLQSHVAFWGWPGTVGVIVAGVGFVVLVTGFVMPKEDGQASVQQRQRGGNRSINLQAGHDIKIGRNESGE
jgi:hypothetical protein